MVQVDGTLETWKDVRDPDIWDGILIGNGASMNVWSDFAYKSLYEVAKSNRIDDPLTADDEKVFKKFDTINFELVLGALRTARMVNHAHGVSTAEAKTTYENVRRALIQAVHAVHVPWDSIPDANLERIGRHLSRYSHVFSVNYDLIIYWSMMAWLHKHQFKDFFFGKPFDLGDTDVTANSTSVYWLHGGLHLYRTTWGETIKREAQPGANLLELFATKMSQGAVPLFVSEGDAEDKLRVILSSDYLSFCYRSFAEYTAPLVVFGLSLSDPDDHLVKRMRQWSKRKVAFAVMPGTEAEVKVAKANIIRKLPNVQPRFFDATTHPLGKPTLHVTP